MRIRRKTVRVQAPRQTNRVLANKPSQYRIVVAEEVVVQPRLFVAILVLQPQRLMDAFCLLFFLQSAPGAVPAPPDGVAGGVGQRLRYADLVAVVVQYLPFPAVVCVCGDLGQGFVAALVAINVGMGLISSTACMRQLLTVLNARMRDYFAEMVSERLDLSFGIFALRGEKYSCYACSGS